MPWTDYSYQVGPDGGAFTDLLDYCDSVRLLSEIDVLKRGGNFEIPFIDGEFSDPNKFRSAGTLMIECMLSYTNSSGTVTHTDGKAGHVFENLQALKALLGGQGQHIVLRRSAPHMGDVEALCEYSAGIQSVGPRMRYVFPLRMIEGSWREQTVSTDTETGAVNDTQYNIATGGDTYIYDPTITFTATSAPSDGGVGLTVDDTGDQILFSGQFTTSDVIVANLRTRTFTLNGTRTDSLLERNRAWYLRLPPDDASLGLTVFSGGPVWTVKIDWQNRWL